jgi:hypothetical protein
MKKLVGQKDRLKKTWWAAWWRVGGVAESPTLHQMSEMRGVCTMDCGCISPETRECVAWVFSPIYYDSSCPLLVLLCLYYCTVVKVMFAKARLPSRMGRASNLVCQQVLHGRKNAVPWKRDPTYRDQDFDGKCKTSLTCDGQIRCIFSWVCHAVGVVTFCKTFQKISITWNVR